MCVPPVGVLSSCNCLSNPLFLYCIVASTFCFCFDKQLINFMLDLMEATKKKKKGRKEGDGKRMPLMIINKKIYLFP
jgi:hypothetical protein